MSAGLTRRPGGRRIDFSSLRDRRTAVSWSIAGTYFETCSCELMCPCNFSFDHGATYDYCRVTLVFDIRSGEVEGTDVSGRTLALIAETPKVMTEGNWRLGIFVDDGTSDEQLEKLTAVFGGQMGGPMAGLAPLIGEVLGVERAPIQVVEEGLRHSVRIGEAIDFEVKDIVPFGIETGEPARLTGVFHPVASELTAAEATRSSISAFGIEYEGKTGLSSPFSWAA
jgi:hypothetical protein